MKVKPNEAAPFAVTLSATAPAGGATVTLKSSDTSKVVVNPASVVIPEGATTPTTQPQVTGVGIGAATITATATGYTSGAGVVTVTPPTMSFSGSPLVIARGGSGKLTLNLSGGQAPAGGLTASLHSSDASKATVPGTVSFAPGATSVTVPVTGVTPGTTTITASASNIASATAAVTVTPLPTVTASYAANFLQVINVVLTNTSGVNAVNLRITSVTNVTAVAPNVIALRPNVIIPMPYGNLAGGQAVARNFTFLATAGTIEVPFSFVVTYEADNMPPQTAVIDVPFRRSMNFSGSPLAINAGASGTLTLKLLGNQAPAAGLIVNLSSSDPSRITVPATVSFVPGATSVTVPVTGIAPGSAVITATATVVNFPALATAAVNVTGAIKSPVNTPVRLGQSAPFAVTLPAPAPAGGVTVTLKSSDTSKVTVTPASVVIPQGATAPATQPQVTGAGIGSATITAAAVGYISGAGAVTVTPPTMSFTGTPLVIAVGESGKLTLTLSGQAPAGGLAVNLNSSDSSKATVPGTISFAKGATSVTVSVASVAPGAATITASGPNIASATASVTVTGTIKSPDNTSVNLGQSTSFAVTLSAPAPAGGVTVTLKSSDTSKVVVIPASVIIPQGATKPTTQPQVTGAGIGTATITATATGYTSSTGTVTVRATTMDFTGSPLVVAVGGSGKLTLTLSGGQAPAGGLTVNLNSSDTSKATVPATVSFAPGTTTVTVPVTAVAPGAVKITASASNIASATAAVTITGAINLPANTPVKLGQSASLAVTLSAPAPVGGVTVNLKTNDEGSKVIVTPESVTIPQGATTPPTQPQVRGAGIGSVTITAAATGYTSGTGTVTVAAPTMTLVFTGSPLVIAVGVVGNLTLSLTGGPVPAGGLTVHLNASGTSKVKVSVVVSFAARATSVTVPVAALAPGTGTIIASAAGIASATSTVTVTPPPAATVTAAYASRSLERINVVLTNTSGVTAVNLRIVNITEVTAVAPNVIVPRAVFQASDTLAGGQASVGGVTFEARAGRLDVPFRFTIIYEADNMPVRTAVIDVPFPQAMSFAGSPLTINAGASGNLTLNLTGTKAPEGGLTVNLNSSDPSKATLPRTVSFPAGATSVSVPVAAMSPGTTTITASAPGLASATTSVTVSPPPTVTASYGANFLQLINVGLVNTSRVTAVNLRITKVTNVTTAKPNVIALRPNVIIPMPYGNVEGGQGTTRSFTFEALAGSIEVPFSFTLTCEADNMPPQTAVIDVPFPRSMSFLGSPLAIRAGDQGKLTLNLLGNQAPARGLVVDLNSSDPSKASVPATVSFPPGATSVTVPVTGLAPGSVTITATATVVNFPATATAIVNVGGGR